MLFQDQNGRCMYCGKKEKEVAYFEFDHIKAVAKDGSNAMANFQMVCPPCNKRKGKLSDGEFRRLYKLTPARQVKGPPTKVIPQSHFEKISAEIGKKKAKTRQRSQQRADDFSFW